MRRQENRSIAGGTYRLNQFLARCGIASRRKADELIRSSLVTVNGRMIHEPGFRVDPIKDVVRFRGKMIHPSATITLILHKPKGVLCTRNDPRDRKTVFDLIPGRIRKAGVQSIGRLDFDSTGLLILTNDGDLHQAMEHPSSGVTREYRVKTRGRCGREQREKLISGVDLEEGHVRAEKVETLRFSGGISRLSITLNQGRNREVRRLCEAVGLHVLDLKRVRFGEIRIGSLPSGKWREPSSREKEFFERIKPKAGKGSRSGRGEK